MVYTNRINVLMAIAVALSVVYAAPTQPTSSIGNQAICTTPQCVLTAAGILNDIDPESDPCQDFNQFACGGFVERNEIPAEESSTNYFSVIYNDNAVCPLSISCACPLLLFCIMCLPLDSDE
ncbi:MAG: hypothetical protein J3R72DRAFT_214394 [Linnemannia gamsii]|nr:MAG: hypothetical protein J3R72DRAFT_214394 [Linnemannia gamsii]